MTRLSPFLLIALVVALVIIGASFVTADAPLPDPLEAGWKGESVCEVLRDTDQHRVLRCTFPPGVGHERHFHAAHFGYVLEGGRMRIRDERGEREVDTAGGSSWSSDGVDWHEVLNVGDTTTSYLIIEPRQP